MQRETNALSTISRIAKKEVILFFSSPIAYLFLAAFAAVTLFIFFWAETFFARNIADVRPMFEWMPILLIFLASTLTMRLWSEERRTGTLEHVLTQPQPLWHFVVGKFAACLILLAIALFITLPLPLTVSFLGELDWGPVWSGYLATFLLGAAYLSIGLFVSARCDNQIVSLISAVALCGAFYMIGTSMITGFFGTQGAEWLRLIGTGSRFESITRGMIDFRDLYYYLSIIIAFLVLNVFVLEQARWSVRGDASRHGQWKAVTALIVANAVVANFWLGQITAIRVDTTQGNQYSISRATENYLNQLEEPLLIRGYFSSETHPLLSPLIPRLRDLMREYEIVGGDRVNAEFVDPVQNPELEDEANQRYGIRPVPFQVEDRYQSSIVNSYFNVLVEYGDQYEVLGFEELIEVQSSGAGSDVEVDLRNPELDLTRAIRTVLNNYQAGGNLFNTVDSEVQFTGYFSADEALPESLVEFKSTVETALEQVSENSGGQFSYRFVDPEANGGQVAQRIAEEYGFRPMSTSLLSEDSFYFYMMLNDGSQTAQVPLGEATADSFQRNLEAGIKRFASGFTNTLAVVTPSPEQPAAGPRAAAPSTPQFSRLRSYLNAEMNVQDEDLSDGSVSGEADLLILLAPESLDETQLFAVDQFLMRGGTVIAATSPFRSNLAGGSLSLNNADSGLEDWLNHHGLSMRDQLVMDPQSAVFPVPVTRNVSGFTMREWRMLDYPYFVDVRNDGLNQEHPVTSDIPQLTLAWSSPIAVDSDANAGRDVSVLFESSPQSWLSESTDVMPSTDQNGAGSYTPEGDQQRHTLGVVASGRFESYFAGESSPLLEQQQEQPQEQEEEAASIGSPPAQGGVAAQVQGQQPGAGAIPGAPGSNAEEDTGPTVSSVIERSAESARIMLISSSDFLNDQILQLLGVASGGDYQVPLQMMANAVDWSLQDSSLLSIRARGNFNRTLPALDEGEQRFWEYLNYSLAGAALAVMALIQRQRRISRDRQYTRMLSEESEA